MIKYLILLILLWLVVRRVVKRALSPRADRRRPPYPGPQSSPSSGSDIKEFTQQEISDAEFEDLEEDSREQGL